MDVVEIAHHRSIICLQNPTHRNIPELVGERMALQPHPAGPHPIAVIQLADAGDIFECGRPYPKHQFSPPYRKKGRASKTSIFRQNKAHIAP
jgi:hypothetical protein